MPLPWSLGALEHRRICRFQRPTTWSPSGPTGRSNGGGSVGTWDSNWGFHEDITELIYDNYI
jgi:hypothetical protein